MANDPIIVNAPEYVPLNDFPLAFNSAESIRSPIIANGKVIVPPKQQKQRHIIARPNINFNSCVIGIIKINIRENEILEKIKQIVNVFFSENFCEIFCQITNEKIVEINPINIAIKNSLPLKSNTNVAIFTAQN